MPCNDYLRVFAGFDRVLATAHCHLHSHHLAPSSPLASKRQCEIQDQFCPLARCSMLPGHISRSFLPDLLLSCLPSIAFLIIFQVQSMKKQMKPATDPTKSSSNQILSWYDNEPPHRRQHTAGLRQVLSVLTNGDLSS